MILILKKINKKPFFIHKKLLNTAMLKWLLFPILITPNAFAKHSLSAYRLQQLSGETVHEADQRQTWDSRYSGASYVFGKDPAHFLKEEIGIIPANSRILDIGMGEGRNAVFLAKHGHNVLGIDISSMAVKKAQVLAKESNVSIKAMVSPIERHDFQKNTFDVIICFYFVDKNLIPKMLNWLRPGGYLIFEAFTHNHPDVRSGKLDKSEVVVASNLPNWFRKNKIIKFVNKEKSLKYTASIIVQKE